MHLRVRLCLIVGIQAQLPVGRFDSDYRTLAVRSAAQPQIHRLIVVGHDDRRAFDRQRLLSHGYFYD